MRSLRVLAFLGIAAAVGVCLMPETAQAGRWRNYGYYDGGYGYGNYYPSYGYSYATYPSYGNAYSGYAGGYRGPVWSDCSGGGYAQQPYQGGYVQGGYGQGMAPGGYVRGGYAQGGMTQAGYAQNGYAPMPGGNQSTAASATVNMNDNSFEPQTVNIQPGATVRWVNKGQQPHTVTASDNRFDSGNIPPGGTYQMTFSQPGTYTYICKLHQKDKMEGTIIVAGTGNGVAPPQPQQGQPLQGQPQQGQPQGQPQQGQPAQPPVRPGF